MKYVENSKIVTSINLERLLTKSREQCRTPQIAPGPQHHNCCIQEKPSWIS